MPGGKGANCQGKKGQIAMGVKGSKIAQGGIAPFAQSYSPPLVQSTVFFLNAEAFTFPKFESI